MTYDSSKPLKKAGNQPAPQYWNDDINDWEIVKGSGGAYRQQASAKVSADPFSASANLTKEFTEDMSGFVISNDGNADLTFTIGTQTFTVKAGEVFEEEFPNFRTAAIVSSVPFRAYGKKSVGTVAVSPPPADTTAPSNAGTVTATNITQTSLTLNWPASTDNVAVAGYDIYRGSTLIGTATGTTFNVTGLTAATQYTFTVKAKDAANNIATGTAATFTTQAGADVTPPNNVASVTYANVTQNSLTLNWSVSSSSDVASYEVYQATTLLGTVTGTTYSVTGLSASTSYTFTVKAKDTSNNVASGTSVTVSTNAVPADTTAPTVTASPAAGTYTSAQSVTLTGTDDSGGAVTIYYTTNGSTPDQTSAVYSAPISVSATASIKYFGKDAAGNVSTVQTAVYTINTITIPATPTAPTATPGNNKVDLTWTAVSGATSYKVYRGGTLLASPTTTTYSDTTVVNGTAYSYTISAVNSAGESAQSPAANATPAAPTGGVIASDSFTGVDGTALNGRATESGGKTWVAGAGTWIINGNQAFNSASQANNNLTVDAGTADCTVEAKFAVSIGTQFQSPRLIVRFTDNTNYWYVGTDETAAPTTYWLRCINAGTMLNKKQFTPTTTPANGDVMKIKLTGTTFEVFQNGTSLGTWTDAIGQTATKHGLGGTGGSSLRLDAFNLTSNS